MKVVDLVISLDAIVEASTYEDSKLRAIKIEQFFNASRSEESIHWENICDNLGRVTKLASAIHVILVPTPSYPVIAQFSSLISHFEII